MQETTDQYVRKVRFIQTYSVFLCSAKLGFLDTRAKRVARYCLVGVLGLLLLLEARLEGLALTVVEL